MSTSVHAPDTSVLTAPTTRSFGITQWFANLSVAVKLFTAVGALALAAVIGGVVAGHGLLGLKDEMSTLVEQEQTTFADLNDIRANEKAVGMQVAGLQIGMALANGEKGAMEKLASQLADSDTEITDLITQVDKTIAKDFGGADTAWWDDFKSAWLEFEDVTTNTLLPLAERNESDAFAEVYETQVLPLVEQMSADTDEADAEIEAEFSRDATKADEEAKSSLERLIIVFVAGLAIAIAIALYVSRAIRNPLRKVQRSLDAMARRDLTVAAEVSSRDEVGQMAASYEQARSNMRSIITQIVDSSDAVAAAAQELSASSTQIAAAAEETSVQADAVAAASGQVSARVQNLATAAQEMTASIAEIASNASGATRIAQNAVDAAQVTNVTIARLGESSRAIENVVRSITAIAEQTNMLALNATIEAARAGEQGKGFAVVASEVKELAQETATATDDVVKRVEAIQADTDSAVVAIDEISRIIGSINEYQTTIASAVEEQTATTSEMGRSVTEAATGTEDISGNIVGVAQASSSTSEGVVQVQVATDELSQLAHDLRAQVMTFTF